MKKQIPTDKHVTYQLQFRKCGKLACSTCRKSSGHGPYWYAYWRTGSKLISGYIGKRRTPQYQQRQLRYHDQPSQPSISEPQAPASSQATPAEKIEPAEPVELVAIAFSAESVMSTMPILEAAATCI